MKSSRVPAATLLVLLGAAALVVFAGLRFAKQETVERSQPGREELSDFAGALFDELQRLDALYENHLLDVAGKVNAGSEIAIRAAGEHLIGLRQISLVPREGRGVHAAYPGALDDGQLAIPVIHGNDEELTGGRRVAWLEPHGPHGWMGEWFFAFRADLDLHVVLAVDRAAVLAAIEGWIAEWYGPEFEPVAVTGARVGISGPAGTVLSGMETRAPDQLLPLKTHFGRWRLAAWNEITTRTSYNSPTVVVSSALALGLALLGIAAFLSQRRWQRLAEQRVSFVNRVSHELRTPLTNILLNTDLAAESMQGSPAEAGRRLGLVREEAGRLSRLIENVLSFSRSERGEARLAAEALAVDELVEGVLAPFRPALRRRGIEVELDLDPGLAAMADRDACAQVLSNLVSNVEKYAASGGWMEIAGGRNAHGAWIAISDRGPGIPGNSVQRIFTPFERLGERVDEGVTGTGLGLAIARDLARRMGGNLRLEPRDHGARFVLELPEAPGNVVGMPRSAAS